MYKLNINLPPLYPDISQLETQMQTLRLSEQDTEPIKIEPMEIDIEPMEIDTQIDTIPVSEEELIENLSMAETLPISFPISSPEIKQYTSSLSSQGLHSFSLPPIEELSLPKIPVFEHKEYKEHKKKKVKTKTQLTSKKETKTQLTSKKEIKTQLTSKKEIKGWEIFNYIAWNVNDEDVLYDGDEGLLEIRRAPIWFQNAYKNENLGDAINFKLLITKDKYIEEYLMTKTKFTPERLMNFLIKFYNKPLNGYEQVFDVNTDRRANNSFGLMKPRNLLPKSTQLDHFEKTGVYRRTVFDY